MNLRRFVIDSSRFVRAIILTNAHAHAHINWAQPANYLFALVLPFGGTFGQYREYFYGMATLWSMLLCGNEKRLVPYRSQRYACVDFDCVRACRLCVHLTRIECEMLRAIYFTLRGLTLSNCRTIWVTSIESFVKVKLLSSNSECVIFMTIRQCYPYSLCHSIYILPSGLKKIGALENENKKMKQKKNDWPTSRNHEKPIKTIGRPKAEIEP